MIHLPNDVLEPIFLTLAAADNLQHHILSSKYYHDCANRSPTTRLHPGVVRLAPVSKQWRDILYATGRFWITELLLDVPSTKIRSRIKGWSPVQDWRTRIAGSVSRNSGLDIRVEYFYNRPTDPREVAEMKDCLLMLQEHSERICRIWMKIPILRPLVGVINNLQNLKRLERLTISDAEIPKPAYTDVISPEDMLDLKHARWLAELEIQGYSTPAKILPPSESPLVYRHSRDTSETSYNAVGYPADRTLRLIRSMRDVCELRLLPLHIDPKVCGQLGERIRMQHLRKLTVLMTFQSYSLFASSLGLPSLAHLDIYFIKIPGLSTQTHQTPSLDFPSLPSLTNLKISVQVDLGVLFYRFLRMTVSDAKIEHLKVELTTMEEEPGPPPRLETFSHAVRNCPPDLTIVFREAPQGRWKEIFQHMAPSLDDVTTLSIRKDGHRVDAILGSEEHRRRRGELHFPNLAELQMSCFNEEDSHTIFFSIDAPSLTKLHFSPPPPSFTSCNLYPMSIPKEIKGHPYLHVWAVITSLSMPLLEFDLKAFENPLRLFQEVIELRIFVSARNAHTAHRRRVLSDFMEQPLLLPQLSMLKIIMWNTYDLPAKWVSHECEAFLQNIIKWRGEHGAPIQKAVLAHERQLFSSIGQTEVWSNDQYYEKKSTGFQPLRKLMGLFM